MNNAFLVVMCFALWPLTVAAQDDQSLADVRQDLTVLNVEIQKLKLELSTTSFVGGGMNVGVLLDRVEAIENELQRLTDQTEQLEFRIDRIVADGTNRIGDLEFRLVELEGGDVSALVETSTLGGEAQVTSLIVAPVPQDVGSQLATQEAAAFERASEALASGDFQSAAAQFAAFNQTYPGGPLRVEADLMRGDALDKTGDTRSAARAYLEAFSTDQTGTNAPSALLKLGGALGRLGQINEACVTLAEVSARFPNSDAALEANSQRRNIGCL